MTDDPQLAAGTEAGLRVRSASFDAQLESARPAVRAFAGRLVGRTALAQEIDDVVQDTLTRALRSAHRHDGERALEPWLFGICVRVVADRHRARRAVHGEPAEEPTERGGESTVDARDELEHCLARLAVRERDVLLAYHRDGRAVAEIADALGAPAGTIKSLLHRARRKLAEAQEDER